MKLTLLDLPDSVLSIILKRVSRGPDGIVDIARVSCVDVQLRALALEHMRTMRTLDMRSLGRRARVAAPHLARRCESLVTLVCDRTNVTDECVTALLAASERTLRKLSLADCRHLRNLHAHAFEEDPRDVGRSSQAIVEDTYRAIVEDAHGLGEEPSSSAPCRITELNLHGSSWSPKALVALLRAARHSLVALNLSSTHVSHSNLPRGEDFGEVAKILLACRNLRRLHLGVPVDFVVPCLTFKIFGEIDRVRGLKGLNFFQGMEDRAPFFSLSELSLERNGAANDVMLSHIYRQCPNLKRLDLRGCPFSSSDFVSFIGGMENEEDVWVPGARCAPGLESLLLGGCDSLDDDGLATVASRCSQLVELDLSMHDRVGPAGIEALAKGCERLRRLRISRNARVTAESLAKLARGAEMETLSAVRCRRAGEPALQTLQEELRGHGEVGERGCRIDWVGDDFQWAETLSGMQ